MKYEIKSEFIENLDSGRHVILEIWECDEENVKKTLADILDLQKDSDGFALEPDFTWLSDILSKFADLEFIENEFSRMQDNFRVYQDLIARLSTDPIATLNDNCKISISRV